jgi:hypothetical protein
MLDYLFHTYDVSFGFLEPAGKVFQSLGYVFFLFLKVDMNRRLGHDKEL